MFLPLFFSGHLFKIEEIAQVLLGFICFSFVASAIYIINDVKDVEEDRLHPEKKMRPFASGAVGISTGLVLAAILSGSALLGAYLLSSWFLYVLSTYFVLNILYSLRLKHIPVVDISIIAFGFLLRVLAGGILADVVISHWIIIMTFLLALFLGMAKRRDDVRIYLESGQKMRKSIEGYNLEFINASMVFMAAVVVVSYIMYTISDEVVARIGSEHLYITSIFVILGVLRYLQLAFVYNNSGNPTKILLKDRFIQAVLILWVLAFYLIIYVTKPTL